MLTEFSYFLLLSVKNERFDIFDERFAVTIGGRTALVPSDIDFSYIPDASSGLTNLDRILKGLAPIDSASGKALQLHHIGPKADGTLAVLKEEWHREYSDIIHIPDKVSEIDRVAFDKVRDSFWKYVGNTVLKNGGI